MKLLHLFVAPDYRSARLRLAFAVYLLVLAFGSIPGAREEVGHLASGIVLHFSTYSSIAALLFSGMTAKPTARAVQCCMIVALMGALDEILQSFLPYRTADVLDWYVDVSAALFTCAVLRVIYPIGPAPQPRRP